MFTSAYHIVCWYHSAFLFTLLSGIVLIWQKSKSIAIWKAKERFKGSENLILEMSMRLCRKRNYKPELSRIVRGRKLKAFSPSSDSNTFIIQFDVYYNYIDMEHSGTCSKAPTSPFQCRARMSFCVQKFAMSSKLFFLLSLDQTIFLPHTIFHFLQVCKSVKELLLLSLNCLGVWALRTWILSIEEEFLILEL